MTHRLLAALAALLMVCSSAHAQMPAGEFLESPGVTAAVILAHVRGQGPDAQVVGPLRRALAKDAGMHALSLQMPVLATPDYRAYASTFPDAYRAIQAAIDFPVRDKGVKRIYLAGYSTGARMTTAFLAATPRPEVVGYIGVGIPGGGGDLLDANPNAQDCESAGR